MEYTKVTVTAGNIADWQPAYLGGIPARHTVEVKLSFSINDPVGEHWEIVDAIQRAVTFNGTLMVKIPGDKDKTVEAVRAEAVELAKSLLSTSLVKL